MKAGKTFFIAFLCAVAALSFNGCAKFKDIRPVSAEIYGIQPEGLRSVVLDVSLEVDNPASQVSLSEITGVVYHSGKVLGRVAVDPFVLEARKQKEYALEAVVTLDESQSLMSLMSVATDDFVEKCTVDLSAKASLKGGASKDLGVKNVPLSKLLNL